MGKTLVILLFALSLSARAEEKLVGPVESTFKNVEHPWLVAGVFELPFYSFYLGAPAVHGQAYLPNFLPRLGVRAGFKDFGAMVTVGLPVLGKSERRRRGESTQSGITINSYWRQYAFDLYFQHFRGFYISGPFTELSFNKPYRYPQLPETEVTNYGANLYYALNPERYSLKAAFDQNEFQLKSGGSVIVDPFYNHLEMFLGNAFIPGSEANMISALPNLASGRFDTFGIALGYGYTYIRANFFATAQGAMGPGLQYQRIQRGDGNDSRVTSLAGKLNVNLASGWNYPTYLGGVKILVDSLSAKVVDTQVTSSLVSVQFFFGRRF